MSNQMTKWCPAHGEYHESLRECPTCGAERANQRRINNVKRAQDSKDKSAEFAARESLFSDNLDINRKLHQG